MSRYWQLRVQDLVLLIARTVEPPFGRNAALLNFIFFFFQCVLNLLK